MDGVGLTLLWDEEHKLLIPRDIRYSELLDWIKIRPTKDELLQAYSRVELNNGFNTAQRFLKIIEYIRNPELEEEDKNRKIFLKQIGIELND